MLAASATAESLAAAGRMDRLYRRQRHIYNFTRKFFLLGRDRLIERLRPAPGDRVIEIGCGTGRNLIRAARRYPHARFFGIDISAQMLASAHAAVAARHLASRIRLGHADATAFNPAALFGTAAFERVFISYSLSMIPDWIAALRQARALLAPHGELHVVDFGDQRGLPVAFRTGLRRWLARFEVIPCDGLETQLHDLMPAHDTLEFRRPFGGYAQYAFLRRIE